VFAVWVEMSQREDMEASCATAWWGGGVVAYMSLASTSHDVVVKSRSCVLCCIPTAETITVSSLSGLLSAF
jgi:hypothetical protein